MVWNRNSDHIQDMWFCKRRECSGCAPIASNNRVCPKGHSKQHYFGGTIGQWRGKQGLSPTYRVEPWQYNNQQGKKGNKGRDSQLESLRKQLQEEKAANAKLKGTPAPEEPASMEVDQGMGKCTVLARLERLVGIRKYGEHCFVGGIEGVLADEKSKPDRQNYPQIIYQRIKSTTCITVI